MKKLLSLSTLGITGLVTVGLLAFSPVASTANDDLAKRDEDTPDLVLVSDDDDDDTNKDTDTGNDTNTGFSKSTNDNTNSRFTKVSRDRDKSRSDKTRDWTRDGGDRTRDWSARKTNDKSRNDTRARRR